MALEPSARVSPAEDVEDAASARNAPPTLDDHFWNLNGRIPGFGGYYLNDNQELAVQLVNPTEARQATARQVLTNELAGRRWGTRSGQPVDLPRMIFVPADYDFRQLKGWMDSVRPGVLAISGVSLLDADEARNRLVIGISRPELRARVEAALAQRNVPRAAVLIELIPIAQQMKTLRDRFDQGIGGIQIRRGSSTGRQCTLGFNIRWHLYPEAYFVTNAHCTTHFGELDNAVFFQGGRRIGYETHDPPLFDQSVDGRCTPNSVRCRYSDAAVVRYDAVSLSRYGYIAQTAGSRRDSATIQLNPTRPEFRIRNDLFRAPVHGETLNKIGQWTGWTVGEVTATCADLVTTANTRQGQPIVLLCQGSVNAGTDSGDSGSPVFVRYSDTEVGLIGLLWGGERGRQFHFSPIDLVQWEIGTFTSFQY